MSKTKFKVTPFVISDAIHLPSNVKILDVRMVNGEIEFFVEGIDVPDKEECHPVIRKIYLQGDTINRWEWE